MVMVVFSGGTSQCWRLVCVCVCVCVSRETPFDILAAVSNSWSISLRSKCAVEIELALREHDYVMNVHSCCFFPFLFYMLCKFVPGISDESHSKTV
ncbi:hypothetical protein INR49_012408 [Caranx melampygus]|nr:hypothetical protein INR49_012408 [Caranx melampygus]